MNRPETVFPLTLAILVSRRRRGYRPLRNITASTNHREELRTPDRTTDECKDKRTSSLHHRLMKTSSSTSSSRMTTIMKQLNKYLNMHVTIATLPFLFYLEPGGHVLRYCRFHKQRFLQSMFLSLFLVQLSV